jgi:aspartyl-tRNA(Asn)/glutamyl-tRNA(Gln) amidotransferase subunit A
MATVAQTVDQALSAERQHQGLNAFLETFDESAKAQAERVDDRMRAGDAGPLAGLVVSIKDNICYKGHRVSAASRMLQGYVSPYSATVVERMLAADAVVIGRTNCDEFAMGSSNETSAYGPVHHPLQQNKVPGGSSGGAAASVAAGICHGALGSDTGGSIRQPAAFTGTVGFKPTYGRVSRYGLIAFASSLDQIGPITRTVADTAAIYGAIAGHDPLDSTTCHRPVGALSLGHPGKLRLAYYTEALDHPGIDAELRQHMALTIDRLKAEGHALVAEQLPMLDLLVPTYCILAMAEASSNLARFDGIRYGHRSAEATDLASLYKRSRSEGFGAEVQRRILLGTFVLSSGYYDAYYGKGQRIRRLIQEATLAQLGRYDGILLPTSPVAAFDLGQMKEDPVAMYLQDIFTVQANLVGCPAVSVPSGTAPNGLPYGLQLMASPFQEQRLLAMAHNLFRA